MFLVTLGFSIQAHTLLSLSPLALKGLVPLKANGPISRYLFTKPSLKIRAESAIFWNYLTIFRDSDLNYIFFRNTTFVFFKIESWNFQYLLEIKFRGTSQNFNSFSSFRKLLSDWVEILWGFPKYFFKQILKVSAFYLEKQKSFNS